MLKFIVSPIVGYIVFIITVFALNGGPQNKVPDDVAIIAIIMGIIATVVAFKSFPKKSVKESLSDGVSFVKNTTTDIAEMVNEDDSSFYAVAEQEIEDGVINNGLWSQALVAAEGEESKRKVEYMKLRVKQLKKRKV